MTSLPDWKPELDAIVGARHGGQVAGLAERLRNLDARHPNVPEIVFQLAWTSEVHGDLKHAAAQYERALALGLQPNDQAAALIGLGNCLRGAGEHARAVEVLEGAKLQFPDYREIDAYLALALHDSGRSGAAVRTLIETLLDSTEDPGLIAHQRALRYHASRLA
jgi:tetratricopeptide (TPR) repeat protein